MAGNQPRIVITAGDPNGIGPEIALKAIDDASVASCCTPILVGSRAVFASCADRFDLALPDDGMIVEPGSVDTTGLKWGTIDADAGRLAFNSVVAAHELIMAGSADALVTAPWSKEALHLAGAPHVGHTEVLASLNDTADPITLFVCESLRIAFLTRHLSLVDAIAAVTRERIAAFLERLAPALARIGLARPRIAVAALNPHGGEGGLLGREEIERIAPAVEDARSKGIDVTGPIPADAVFHEGAAGKHDCVVALYHDQGHIASKTRDFFGTASLTLGLPYVRTSPDHGTAFDIAGQGRADPGSMIRAIGVAAEVCRTMR